MGEEIENNFRVIPRGEWPYVPENLVEVYQSSKFIVQRYLEKGQIRLSINHVDIKDCVDGKPIWKEGITWDDLQNIKNSIGYEDYWFVEVYPPKEDMVNVANIRHLWLIDKPPYGWSKN